MGIARLSVESSFIDYFDESTEIYQGMRYLDAHLGGTTPLDVLIAFRRSMRASAARRTRTVTRLRKIRCGRSVR